MRKTGKWLGLTLAFLIVAGGSFWLGLKYQQQKFTALRAQFGQGPMRMKQGFRASEAPEGETPNRTGEMIISGKVDNVEEGVITMTTRFGSQKIELSSGVNIEKLQKGSLTDISEGVEILARGERKDDNTLEAREILVGFSLGD